MASASNKTNSHKNKQKWINKNYIFRITTSHVIYIHRSMKFQIIKENSNVVLSDAVYDSNSVLM